MGQPIATRRKGGLQATPPASCAYTATLRLAVHAALCRELEIRDCPWRVARHGLDTAPDLVRHAGIYDAARIGRRAASSNMNTVR
jgi:hypothetical protein